MFKRFMIISFLLGIFILVGNNHQVQAATVKQEKVYYPNKKLKYDYGYYYTQNKTKVSRYYKSYNEQGKLEAYLKYIDSPLDNGPYYREYRTYYTNGKLKQIRLENYSSKDSSKHLNGWIKNYNSNGQLISYFKENAAGKVTYREQKTYYKNGNVKESKVHTFNGIGQQTGFNYVSYSQDKIKQIAVKNTYTNGKLKESVIYQYNSKGQLKTNSSGKAYKYYSKADGYKFYSYGSDGKTHYQKTISNWQLPNKLRNIALH